MITKEFSELVDVKKIAACKTCETYVYKLPCKITKSIEDYLLPLGSLQYSLDHVKIVVIDNSDILINQARIGNNTIKIKFKNNRASPELKMLFDIQLGAFLEDELNCRISI